MNEITIKALRKQVDAERRRAGDRRVRFSNELKARASALAAGAGSKDQLAESLGISSSTLHRWIADAKKVSRLARPKHALQRVAVVRTAEPDPAAKLTLTFPGGAEVSGLTLRDLQRLLGGQS